LNKHVLVIAPHPDDETLGCGGVLLRHKSLGDDIHWLIVTAMAESLGFSQESMARRQEEISRITKLFGFSRVVQLDFPTTRLDELPRAKIITEIGKAFDLIQPELVYVPYRHDAHTDHTVVFDCALACCKWFRYPSIRRILAYETLSETEFGSNPDGKGFQPQVFVGIESWLDKKIEALKIYAGEIGQFPFPRSEEAVRALASLRGSTAGVLAAEAFVLIKEIEK
jgi:N-acetylglucosamine malate deacetylase 1